MKTNRSKAVAVVLAAAVGVAVVLYGTLVASASRPESTLKHGQKLGAQAYFEHGKLRFPPRGTQRDIALRAEPSGR